MSELNQDTPIHEWRAAKAELDKGADLRGLLGCVGEPLYDVFREHLLVLPTAQADELYVALARAAKESRDKLAEMLQDHAQEHVDRAMMEVVGFAEGYFVEDSNIAIDGTDTLRDIAQRGADNLYYAISDWYYHVEKPEGNEL